MGFNPRAPCGARHGGKKTTVRNLPFQSTRPMRGATRHRLSGFPVRSVSIHAPHAGRDMAPSDWRQKNGSFNPRAPCGARLVDGDSFALFRRFQSTRPMRGATRRVLHLPLGEFVSIHAPHAGRDPCRQLHQDEIRVSIHAPHAGRDPCSVQKRSGFCGFNPRAPCGARQRRAFLLLFF